MSEAAETQTQETQTTEATSEEAKTETKQSAVTRPEGLPDDFWDADSNSVKFEDLLSQHNDLKTYKATVESMAASVPEKEDGYELKLPEGFELPDGMTFELEADSDLAKAARAFAHANRLPQDAVSELLKIYASDKAAQVTAANEAAKAEIEKLGPRAEQRLQSIDTWIDAQVADKEQGAALKGAMTSIKAVEALEAIIRKMSGTKMSAVTTTTSDHADLENLTPKQRLDRANKKAMGNSA